MGNFNVSFNLKLSKEEAPKVVPKIVKCMVLTILIYLMNIFFAVWGIIKFIQLDIYTAYNISFFVLLLCLAGLFMFAAVFFTQKYIIITVIKTTYKKMTPFFKTVSQIIAERYVSDDKFQEKINKAFDIGADFGVFYDKNAPWIVKKAVSFFVNRLPFVDFLKNMSPGINKKDIRAVSEAIYVQMDDYMINKLFVNNNLNKIFLLYIVNIASQVLLLFLIK
jgi:hypothetical protein